MAQICIITPTGMKCISSPMKHRAIGGAWTADRYDNAKTGNATRARGQAKALTRLDNKPLSPGQLAAMTKVLRLLLHQQVDVRKPFTLINVP